VLRFDGDRFSPLVDAPELAGASVRTLARAADGTLWVGTSRGLLLVAGDGTTSLVGEADGLGAGAVRDVLFDEDGAAWVGSYGGGLSRVRDGRVERFTRAEGLCDDVVSRILDGGDGALWMNGNRGVFRVPRAAFDELTSGQRSALPCALLESGEGNGGAQPAGWRGRDGRLWFPTIDGLAVVDPAGFDFEPVPPLVAVEWATLDDLPVSDGVALGPGRGDLVVQYAGLAFSPPGELVYKHRLHGYEEAWVDSGTSRVARYAGLPPGSYRFDVVARSVSGESSDVASVSFSKAPGLHERSWFPLAVGLLVLAIVSAAWSLRLRTVARHAARLQSEIDARTTLMDQLRQAQRVEVLGQLAGGVAHDFNNVLMAVGGMAELLQGELEGRESAMAGEIVAAAERGGQLANRLLEFSKGRGVQLEPVSPAAVFTELLPMLQRMLGEGVDMKLAELDPDLRAMVDRVELEQALMNLVVNARDALTGPGSITLSVGACALPVGEARARGIDPGTFVVVSVVDDGEGIDERVRSRLFEPFFTTKEPGTGTGLGLMSVHRVAAQAGGFVKIDSELGSGTTFQLWFPEV